jgi:predicted anti-sigma-YlaC factor YlaD
MDCKQASGLISQSLERKLSLLERLSLKFHLFICDACRMFKHHLGQMSRILKKQMRDVEKDESLKLSDQAKCRIQEAIEHQESN